MNEARFIDEVKKLEKKGLTKFVYYPFTRMQILFACKTLSDYGYNPKVSRNKGMFVVECDINTHNFSYKNGDHEPIELIIYSAKSKDLSFLTKERKSFVLKNPKLFFHILKCEDRYLALSYMGVNTKQGAHQKGQESLKLVSHIKKYKNVHKELIIEVFKFLGQPVPK